MICLLPLVGQMRSDDILNALLAFFDEKNGWSGLASVCTDSAPSMRGKEKRLVDLMKKREEIPNFISFHCKTVVCLVNFIVSRALNHRQFRQFIEDYDTEYGDLLMHSEVRWLSCGKVLEWFLNLLPEICTFLDRKRKTRARAVRTMLDHTAGLSY